MTLDGLTLTNGQLVAGGEAGIYNAGKLTLTRSVVRNNAVCDSDERDGGCFGTGSGGGISNQKQLALQDSTVSGNFATDGGGIANSAQLTLTRSAVIGNYTDDAGGFGECGGIDNRGTATLTSSTVSANGASTGGEASATPARSTCVIVRLLTTMYRMGASVVWSTVAPSLC